MEAAAAELGSHVENQARRLPRPGGRRCRAGEPRGKASPPLAVTWWPPLSWGATHTTVAGVGVASTAMDSQAASVISHEIHGSYGPAFLRNIRLLGWDYPYFLVTNQTHVYHLNVVRQGGDTGAQPTKKMEIWWLARMNALIGFVGVLKKETDS